ncbi:MAG: InlB B-repeat-containing protein, partial [Clostridiaceae bacterium]
DAANVPEGTYWVTEEVMSALDDAIALAQAMVDDDTATAQGDIDDAIADLADAVDIFNDAKAEGTKVPAPLTYTVTFNSNGGSAVANQTIQSGSKATKPANPTKAGYTFGGWYSDDALKNAWDFNTAITKDTTLYAKWTSNGGGGGYFPSTPPTSPTPPAPPILTVPVNTVNATAGANNTASASIPDAVVADALAKALADAAAQGRAANTVAVTVNITVPQGTNSLSAVLSQDALKSLIAAGVNNLTINCGDSMPTVTLGLKALKSLQKQAVGDATIKIAAAPKLSKSAKKLVGDRPVFGTAASYVKRGKVRAITSVKGAGIVSIPYALRPGETPENVFGVSIDNKGNATRVKGSRYDAASGRIIIPITKLAPAYGVGFKAK